MLHKVIPRNVRRASCALVVCWLLASAVSLADQQRALTLAGVTLGDPVAEAVKTFGTPGLVQTTDQGNEWRWFVTEGLDVDLLTDNNSIVRQILVAQPEPANGKTPPLVQPKEFGLLQKTATSAAAAMKSMGAMRQTEPENTYSAWQLGSGFIILELAGGKVLKILALEREAAVRLGYVSGAPPPAYRAPRLVNQYPVNYPKGAIERHAQGTVVVAVDIASSGAVSDVRVVVSSGDPDIDAAESLSMRRSTFRPALCDGVPCASLYMDREEYTLSL